MNSQRGIERVQSPLNVTKKMRKKREREGRKKREGEKEREREKERDDLGYELLLVFRQRRPATVGSLLSTSLKGQAGKIKKHIIQLTGWHVPGQENNCHQANA